MKPGMIAILLLPIPWLPTVAIFPHCPEELVCLP